jgi:hypothetical protein
MNYVMLRNGLQPVIIKSAEKQSYLHALHLADIGDLDAFVDYVALQEQWSLNMAIKAVRGENLDEPGDLDKKLFLLKKKLGQNTSESKIVKKSSEAISRFISESFHSLVDELESKYLEFDTLFYSRRVRVSIDNLKASGTDIYSVFASLWNPLLQRNEELDISVIQISISFHRLRESRTDININGGNLSVSFYDNVYEINFTAAARPVTKLYSEGLSAEECRYIIESLGNFVVESVEVALERESTDN